MSTDRVSGETSVSLQNAGLVQSPPVKSDYGKLVVRYADGRIIKGHSHDFYPNKPSFHLFRVVDGPTNEATEVRMKELKAVFFVRDFAGNPQYNERKQFVAGEQPPGRKVQVKFRDGEVLVGATVGYHRRNPGFFFIPADPRSNNLKVFAVSGAVTSVHFL